jgi:tyrosine-protein phosphatase YwqE
MNRDARIRKNVGVILRDVVDSGVAEQRTQESLRQVYDKIWHESQQLVEVMTEGGRRMSATTRSKLVSFFRASMSRAMHAAVAAYEDRTAASAAEAKKSFVSNRNEMADVIAHG